jgi:hypothetical protein
VLEGRDAKQNEQNMRTQMCRLSPILHRSTLLAMLALSNLTLCLIATGQSAKEAADTQTVWTDPDTKLMWAVKDSGPYEPPSYGLLTHDQAIAYAKNCRLAGFDDWRLPTIEELEQIYDKSVEGYHVKGGVIKPNGDPTGKSHYLYAAMNIWSQSLRAEQGNYWEFNFGYGSRSSTVGGAGIARALCVRGAPAKIAPVAPAVTDFSKYVSPDGITIPSGPSSPGGGVFFSTVEGQESAMSLRGTPPLAVMRYMGTLEPSNDGKVGGGSEKFKPTRIQTSKDSEKWLKIVSFTLNKDGFLIIKDESGASYTIKVSIGTGTIEELNKTSQ